MKVNRVENIDNNVFVQTVLISVADKQNLEILVEGVLSSNPHATIISTGGTFARIEEILGVRSSKNVIPVSEYTGQPEMQGGLVKTLDFKIYLGLLSETYNSYHQQDLTRAQAKPIDMVAVNLYPFKETISERDATTEDARSHIDIGGPCMLRASAKNFLRVAPLCDPGDYRTIADELRDNNGTISFATRFSLAQKAFRHTADYDTAIAEYLSNQDITSVKKIYHVT